MINGWEMDYSTGLIVGDMHGLWAGTGGIVSVTDQTLTTAFTTQKCFCMKLVLLERKGLP